MTAGWVELPVPQTSSPGWQEPEPAQDFDVRLGDIRIRSGGRPPRSGWRAFLRWAGLTGWLGSAQDATQTVTHPSGDGLVPGSPRLEARQITVSMAIIGANERACRDGLDVLARVRRTTLVVAERDRGLVREADVRVTTMQETRIGLDAWAVTLSLIADDPVRHSGEWVALGNGPITLANRGDLTAWPLVELVGPHGTITITHPGGVRTVWSMGVGVRRTLDCRTGALFDGDGNRVNILQAGEGAWPRVPAGGGQWTVAGLGAGSARMRRSEAWS